MVADVAGEADLRVEHFESMVRGFALKEFRLKQIVAIRRTKAFTDTYYRETAADLTAGTTRSIKGIPRMAKFPHGEVSFTKISRPFLKHGLEGQVSWEDVWHNNIDVVTRTLLRISRAVANSVDIEIWNTLTENQSANAINSVSITAGNEWDSATVANRDPIDNILEAMQKITEANFDIHKNGFLIVSPKDYRNLLANPNIRNAGQFYTSDVTRNGRVGKLLGLTVIVTTTATAEFALVCVGQECGTWVEAESLKVITIGDEGIKYTIRAWENGVAQLTTPTAITLIDNTQA